MSELRTDEQFFNDWLRNQFGGRDEDFMRVENSIGNGVPDINICKAGYEVWVESKVVEGRGTLLRKEQYAWLVRRSCAGGLTFVLSWDKYEDYVIGWQVTQFLQVRSIVGDKYVVIYGPPDKKFEREQRPLKKFLFPHA